MLITIFPFVKTTRFFAQHPAEHGIEFDVIMVRLRAFPSSSDFDATSWRNRPHPLDVKRTVLPSPPFQRKGTNTISEKGGMATGNFVNVKMGSFRNLTVLAVVHFLVNRG